MIEIDDNRYFEHWKQKAKDLALQPLHPDQAEKIYQIFRVQTLHLLNKKSPTDLNLAMEALNDVIVALNISVAKYKEGSFWRRFAGNLKISDINIFKQ